MAQALPLRRVRPQRCQGALPVVQGPCAAPVPLPVGGRCCALDLPRASLGGAQGTCPGD